jgi:hypothetical protein
MRIITTACLVFLVAMPLVARADIERLAQPCGETMCFHWWPRLQELPGWHHDRGSSLQLGINALAPDGFTFSNAEAVIYARALFKPRIPQTTSLIALIENDKAEFLRHSPDIVISESEGLLTADGQKLKSLVFKPSSAGNWERVSYGEEGEFYLLFTLSARSESAYQNALGAYQNLISQYRERQP